MHDSLTRKEDIFLEPQAALDIDFTQSYNYSGPVSYKNSVQVLTEMLDLSIVLNPALFTLLSLLLLFRKDIVLK